MIGLHYAKGGRIGLVTIDRQPVNAFDDALLAELSDVLDRVESDRTVRVLLFRSVGKCFSAGADIQRLRRWTEADGGLEEWDAFTTRLQHTFARIAALDIPTIAAIHGAATGGGLELALACDLRVVAAEASLGVPEIRLGVVPGAGGTQRLARLVGQNVALRLLLRGEIIKGEEAASLGIAEFCLPRAEVEARSIALAEELAQWPRAALIANKACALSRGGDGFQLELEYTRKLARDPETKALIAAFFAK